MFLSHMSYLEVEEYLKHDDRVIIPVGSLENHGKHMPLGTDTMIPHRIAELMNEKMLRGYVAASDMVSNTASINITGDTSIDRANTCPIDNIVIAPTVPYGATEDLTGFAGTVSIGVDGLINLLTAICDQLYRYGFRKFIILNGHGGNNKSIETVGQHMYDKGALLACVNWWIIAGQIRPEWRGGHGGGEETAGVMGIDPSLIKYEYLEEPAGIRNDISEKLPFASWTSVSFEGATINIPRKMKSISDNGWFDHGIDDPPTKATPEWGREMLDTMADYVLRFAKVFGEVQI